MVANKAATQQKQLLEQKSKWSLKLGELLDFDASDIIQLTIQLDSAREARQYLNSLLDPADRAHTDFVNSYVEDMFGESSSNKADTRQEGQEVIGKRGKKKKGIVPAESSSHSSTYTKPYLNKRAGKTSRKTAGLQSLEQLSSLLHGQLEKGRIKCDCMTGKHALVGNCLACGNIVCAQEGVGVCLSCGEDQVKILDNAMATDADAEQLGITRTARKKNLFKLKQEEEGMDPEKIVALMKAMELKERLLVFDRQMAKRTKVIDDEDDYYELDSRWLDPKTRKAREALKSQLDEAKLELKKKQRTNIITLDIMNQRVVDARDTVTLDESQYRPPPQQSVTAPKNAQDLIWNDPDPYQYANPGLTTPPKYIRDDQSKAGKALHTKPRPALPKLRETYMRVQGEGFVPPPLKDNPGKCMSMHQVSADCD
ncbi:hypothetical protein SARC_00252 [Sphaeroforma arctica JP610]|uniref:Uncharacterized protein n=1 Tax=Sphaeroforma arctica JP610 TaxID=667725 RepID=A0A0L0GFK9_9EUKA|nr:hypothetical protein SARC_00252 [Sphaeroforma arctica JP610]KNC87621.1 hypothetical protein SARC_00252 [Sphaeroforma arctica JP610]|eukprot:XP_014161523.1 hypothetical protein SARC_00252 [Sphaeroforma arctica JP610]